MLMRTVLASSMQKDVVTLKAPLLEDLHRLLLTPMSNARKRDDQVQKH